MNRRLLALGAATFAVLVLTAAQCGTGGVSEGGDVARGKALFVSGVPGKPSCGSCHRLADAGTTATIGPDLDAAFVGARQHGFKESTFREVVLGQIRYPVQSPPTGAPGMPANLVTGQDAEDVAAYVAAVAGKEEEGPPVVAAPPPAPPAAPPPAPPPPAGEPTDGAALARGEEVFASAGCGSCHVLADAGSEGTIGPSLDESKPSRELAIDRVTNGRGAMPSFKGRLSDEEIDAVATYVSTVSK